MMPHVRISLNYLYNVFYTKMFATSIEYLIIMDMFETEMF